MYKLLVADDEPIERETIKMMIAKYFPDIQVVGEAANGREAIAKAREFVPDIIFLDIKMPGILGIEAAKVIKREHPGVKIVMITAYDYFEYARESLKSGIDDFLLKPALKNDIEAVLNRFKQQMQREQEQKALAAVIEKRLRNMAAFIEKEIISAILLRLDEREIAGYFELLGLQPERAYGVIIRVDNKNQCSVANTQAIGRVYNQTVYEEVIRELHRLKLKLISTTQNNLLYILILCNDNHNEYDQKTQALEIMNAVKSAITLQADQELNIGVGLPYQAVTQLTESFLEAELALSFAEPAQSIHYGDIDLKIRTQAYPYLAEKRLCEEIVHGNKEKSREHLEKILHWLVSHCRSLPEMHRIIFELIVMMTRTAAIYEQIDPALLDTFRYFEEVQKLSSIQEIEGYLNRLITDFTGSIHQLRQVHLNLQIAKAFQFIAAHYSKDITLEDVAKAVCLSPPYFSKIFKTETGENFIDYLTRLRMDAAENLLVNQRCSIKDVCYQVGYNDPNYFSRIFKKHFGVNPSEYKTVK